MDPDLPALSSDRAKSLATVLRDVLRTVHFDVVNRELRQSQHGGDYDVRPFPLPGSPVDIPAMKVRLRQGVKASPSDDHRKLARRILYTFMFFMFGEALQREPLEELFGDANSETVDEGLRLGLFITVEGQALRVNGLSLFSRRLPNGEVVHLFADTPPQFERRTATTPRVYIGADSYELMDRIAAMSGSRGCCIEMGSGSGIQLVSALKCHPDITRAIGKERDRRALNVSLFNAALNDVADRMTVTDSDAVLRSELEGGGLSFGMTNPPFLAIPRWINVDETDHGPQVDLRVLFPQAGWGGDDGLEVTKQFIAELQPVLGPGTPLIIYSQFAGDINGPTLLRAHAEQAGFDFSFEPLKSRVFTRRHAAEVVARLITAALLAARQPDRVQTRVKEGSPEHRLMRKLADRIDQSYATQAITHFHDGFAVLTGPAR